jgi:hypothetical protein
MFAIIHLLATFIADLFKSRRRLEVENLFLRHQLNVALRRAPQRVPLRAGDRVLMVWMTRMWPSLLGLTRVVQPATIVCTENLVLVDYGTESPNVNGDDRAALLLPDPARLAVQVEEPT